MVLSMTGPGCSETTTHQPSCGNGVLDPEEECDGHDLGGLRCSDFNCTDGVLTCESDCTIGIQSCYWCPETCGNGIVDWWEYCDCGDDPLNLPDGCRAVNGDPCGYCDGNCGMFGSSCGNGLIDGTEDCDCGYCPDPLPTGCTAINGAPGGECEVDCTLTGVCGDGIEQFREECDCGTDPSDVPQNCTGINNSPTGDCLADCTLHDCQAGEVYVECDPLDPDSCCDDRWGNDVHCDSALNSPLCMLACTTSADCYYNSVCLTQSGVCYPATCGIDPYTVLGGNLYEPCQIPGGGEGYCHPLSIPDDFGICLENSPNALADGEVCIPPAEPYRTFPKDVGYETCLNGLCLDEDNDGVYNCVTLYPLP